MFADLNRDIGFHPGTGRVIPVDHQDSNTYIHIPTPGDHYSSITGSATMTVIYEMSRIHELNDGNTKIVVGSGTRHDYAVGQCLEVNFDSLPTQKQKIVDVSLSRFGLERKFMSSVYRPALNVIDPAFAGPVFLHNAPAPIREYKRILPHSKIILYMHNDLFRTYSINELKKTINAADLVICVSQFLANDLQAKLENLSEKIRVVNNGVDCQRFKSNHNLQSSDEVTILFVGRVVPEKGADLLLQAAQKIYAKKRQFKVKIVGSSGFSSSDPLTKYEVGLREMCIGIEDIVEFIPFVDRNKILHHYQTSSIFCAPSNWNEPVSLTVPEALACGLPTVASRRGGIPEVGGDAVLYFNPPDINELSELLAYLIDNKDARDEWGRRARIQAEQICWRKQYQILRAAVQELYRSGYGE